ncbi:MAG: HEAT repeat domain-containing protein [Candidatus Sumerlaeota bacterium]|nr:HEAT repeat domain-containing protein [Candidatus Sumerlaeota bacterium]
MMNDSLMAIGRMGLIGPIGFILCLGPLPALCQAAAAPSASIRQLSDPDPAVRREAALDVLRKGAEAREAWPALIQALLADADLDRALAAHVLYTKPPTKPDVPAWIESMRNDRLYCAAAAFQLSRLGPGAKEAVPALIEVLRYEDQHPRMFAALALAMIGPDAAPAVPALVRAMEDAGSSDSPTANYMYVRAAAAFALGMIGPAAREAVPALARFMEDNGGKAGGAAQGFRTYQRAAAGFALGEIGLNSDEAIAALRAVSESAEPVARQAAARALARIVPRPKGGPVRIVIGPDAESRCAAIRHIGELGATRPDAVRPSIPFLIKALKDERSRILPFVAPALREITLSLEALPGADTGAKAKKNKAKSNPVRESAALALGYLESFGGAPPSPAELESSDADSRVAANRAFQALGNVNRSAVPILLEALDQEETNVRAAAAQALGRIGPAANEAVPALREALTDPDWVVRAAAAEALRRIEK